MEDPVPVIRLSSIPEQKNILLENAGNQVDQLLYSKVMEERARAAYLAICLDLDKSLAGQYPKEWKQACYELSGYWKIMNNIFEAGDGKNEFSALKALRAKFEAAGFRAPVKSYEDEELYHDLNTWRNPESNNK